MVIYKKDLGFECLYSTPDTNFTDTPDSEVWVINDTSELASKVRSLYPHWTPIINDKGELIDAQDSDLSYVDRVGCIRRQNEFRAFRKTQFDAFDIYKSNLEYGILDETTEQHEEILNWYHLMLDFPESITIANYKNAVFPTAPIAINQYSVIPLEQFTLDQISAIGITH